MMVLFMAMEAVEAVAVVAVEWLSMLDFWFRRLRLLRRLGLRLRLRLLLLLLLMLLPLLLEGERDLRFLVRLRGFRVDS